MKYFHPHRMVRLTKEFFINLWNNYLLPDKAYLKLKYKKHFGKDLNLNNPKTFNEKLQWLKLYDRNPEYHKMVDKYLAKKYVENIIGADIIIPTLGVWKKFDDIDFSKLPEKFVMKCTHDSASVILCNDKSKLDKIAAKNKLNNALKINYYRYENRQWVYKDIVPQILAEEFITDSNSPELTDYKFFCFNGVVKYIQVDLNRFSNHRRNIFDVDWKLQEFIIQYKNDPNVLVEKPTKLKEMIQIAEKLSLGIPHVRVDLYFANNNIYFGEMTFCHGGGTENFIPEIWDLNFGNFISLPI